MPLRSFGIIMGRQKRIGLRIPEVIIDPVDDAEQIILSKTQNPFQTGTIFGGLDFLAVFSTDRSDDLAVNDAGL